jgi:hypothetical protein
MNGYGPGSLAACRPRARADAQRAVIWLDPGRAVLKATPAILWPTTRGQRAVSVGRNARISIGDSLSTTNLEFIAPASSTIAFARLRPRGEHQSDSALGAAERATRTAFVPPNAKEFDMTVLIFELCRAQLGT